jgi:hypothetical protein
MEKDVSLCEPHKKVSNCMVMHEDIAALYREDAIGVDVEVRYSQHFTLT